MNLLLPFASGFGLYIYLMLWRRFASRWEKWFPLVRYGARGGMYLLLIAYGVLAVEALTSMTDTTIAGLSFGAGLMLAAVAQMVVTGPGQEGETHRRGARLARATDVAKLTRKQAPAVPIVIGGVPIPMDAEPYHFLVAGSTGSGKSVAIKGILDTLRQRGDTVLVVDSGGEYLARYWNPQTDAVINPFDSRCAAWSPTVEMSGPWDAVSLARSIIPDGVGDSKEWNGYAQTLLGSCLQSLFKKGDSSLKSVLRAVQCDTIDQLTSLLEGTPAAAQLASEKMFGSIRTIASNYLSAYNYFPEEKTTFSVTNFISNPQPGFLFLSYRDDQLDSLRNLLSCIIDIAARTILSLAPDPHRRVWLIIDEFASIGKVQSIESMATKARKMGGCLVIGLQNVSQIRDRYGEFQAQSILSCLSTWVTLRCIDGDTAEYISKYLGESEITRRSPGATAGENGPSRSITSTVATERVVMAPQLQQMADLDGFLKVSGSYPICPIKLTFPAKRPNVVESFLPRDFVLRPMIDISPPKTEQGGRQNQHRAPTKKPSYTDQVAALKEEYDTEIDGPDGGDPERLQNILDRLGQLRGRMAAALA